MTSRNWYTEELMRKRIETFLRQRRERRVIRLTEIIERETELLLDLDEELWPHDAEQSRARRAAAWRERRSLLAMLPKE